MPTIKPDGQKTDILTVRELAELLKVSVADLFKFIEKYNIPYITKRNRVFFKKDDLQKWKTFHSNKVQLISTEFPIKELEKDLKFLIFTTVLEAIKFNSGLPEILSTKEKVGNHMPEPSKQLIHG